MWENCVRVNFQCRMMKTDHGHAAMSMAMDGIETEREKKIVEEFLRTWFLRVFPSTFDSLRLHSTLLFEQIEANRLAIGVWRSIAWDRRYAYDFFSIYFYELFIVCMYARCRAMWTHDNVSVRVTVKHSSASDDIKHKQITLKCDEFCGI